MPTLPSLQGWRAIQFSGVVAVADLLRERLKGALALVAAAHVLHHDGIAVLHEGLVIAA